MWTFVGQMLSLLFNTPPRFVIAFLPWNRQNPYYKGFGDWIWHWGSKQLLKKAVFVKTPPGRVRGCAQSEHTWDKEMQRRLRWCSRLEDGRKEAGRDLREMEEERWSWWETRRKYRDSDLHPKRWHNPLPSREMGVGRGECLQGRLCLPLGHRVLTCIEESAIDLWLLWRFV